MGIGFSLEDGKSYFGTGGGCVFLVHPSAQHPGYWWGCKIEEGVWEGMKRPMTKYGIDVWAEKVMQEMSLTPEQIQWITKKWDGQDMVDPGSGERSSRASNCVYFIEAAGLNRVKIGLCTSDPSSRLSQIRLLSPVELQVVGQIPGDAKTEHALHERFSKHQIHGEWFEFDKEIHEYIKLNCGGSK